MGMYEVIQPAVFFCRISKIGCEHGTDMFWEVMEERIYGHRSKTQRASGCLGIRSAEL